MVRERTGEGNSVNRRSSALFARYCVRPPVFLQRIRFRPLFVFAFVPHLPSRSLARLRL
jgi:hypothetical protein